MPAPLIAAALSALAPALAKRGLDLLSGVFRGALDIGTTEIGALIEEKTGIDISDVAEERLTEAQWGQLRAFEFEYQGHLLAYRQQHDATRMERERIAQADRASARDLQKSALAGDDRFTRRFIYYYALGITILTFLFIFCAAFIADIQPGNKHIIDTVLGFLLGVSLSAIIQFFFGSSAGSKAKDARIGDLTRAFGTQFGSTRGDR